MEIDTSIFKAYDIRGVYPDELNEEIAKKVGMAFAEVIKNKYTIKSPKIAVGRDMRTSSPSLRDALVKGLTMQGADVTDMGLISTPTYYFGVGYFGFDGGIQVSASHNPKEFNGFKMVARKSEPVGGDSSSYKLLQKLVVEGGFSEVLKKGYVKEQQNIVVDAVRVQSEGIEYKKIKPFKIVVDTGNGSGILDIDAMFSNLPCELFRINQELDGTFPAHVPDPLKEENLKWAKDEVIKKNADLAIVPDGDGDRYFFLDEKGDVVPQSILRGLMAQIELKKNPGVSICYDIRPGKITKEMIQEAKGVPVITRVGHSFIKQKMLETGAVFGGESSGHYYYKLPYGVFEAPIILVLKFLIYLSESGKPLSELLAPYKKYFSSGEINSDVTDKTAKMDKIVQIYRDGNIDKLDGVTIEFPNYWFNVRPSNTENLLRLNLEAVSQDIMEKKRDEILKLIRS